MTRHGVEEDISREQLRVLVEGAGAHGMQVVVSDVDGVPLSAGFVMAHGSKTVYDIWAGTSAIGLTKGAAAARYICLLGELQARGYEYFDWCGASLPGISDFKLGFWGALTTRLAISREPLWYKAGRLVHVCLLRLKNVLKGH